VAAHQRMGCSRESSSSKMSGRMNDCMRRTIIGATIFLSSLLPARAEIAVYIYQGSGRDMPYTSSKTCVKARAAQTRGSVSSREAMQCSRRKDRRPTSQATLSDNKRRCVAYVLHSEELPGAPIFYHIVRATLLITSPSRPAFQTTVQNLVSWQVPPPRQGQRLLCDLATRWIAHSAASANCRVRVTPENRAARFIPRRCRSRRVDGIRLQS
jgi:hypothetical protein